MPAATTDTALTAESLELQVTQQLSSLIALQETFKQEVEDRFREILERIETMGQRITSEAPVPTEMPTAPSMDWEAKKQAIYMEHGMTVDRADGDGVETTSVYGTAQEARPDGQADQAGSPGHFDAMALSDADHQAVEQLKAELHEKLRAAEVELSISRAKIAQETAQLEERRHELENLAAQADPSTAPRTDGKKPSMLERLSLHMLPARKPS